MLSGFFNRTSIDKNKHSKLFLLWKIVRVLGVVAYVYSPKQFRRLRLKHTQAEKLEVSRGNTVKPNFFRNKQTAKTKKEKCVSMKFGFEL